MLDCFTTDKPGILIIPILTTEFSAWLQQQTLRVQQWVKQNNFTAQENTFCLLPDEQGGIAQVAFGIEHVDHFWSFGDLPLRLPLGCYDITPDSVFSREKMHRERIVLAWGLGSYCFSRYKTKRCESSQLRLHHEEVDGLNQQLIKTIYWVRDLINTPTEDMGPQDLAQAAQQLQQEFDAQITIVAGEQLLQANYPTIYTVGRGADDSRQPRLIDLQWGDPAAPKLTLVGKGVCFDSGGLNIKPTNGMRLMKKDMAGAAHVLGLARMVMVGQLPVRLRVLIPAVENAVDGSSYRPGDIIKTRAGLQVEVTNTDAEGRLVLCDALAEAVTEQPDQLIDFSTLTGAARVALGPDVAAFFTNSDEMAAGLQQSAMAVIDPVWRLPLFKPYLRYLDSEVADISNASESGHGGAITAALYLEKFVSPAVQWAHFDMMAWNEKNMPGRPAGGEASALRAVWEYLKRRYNAQLDR